MVNTKKLKIMVKSNGEWKPMKTTGYLLHFGPIILIYMVLLFYLSWIVLTGIEIMIPLWIGIIIYFILFIALEIMLYFIYLLLIKPEKLIQDKNLEEK